MSGEPEKNVERGEAMTSITANLLSTWYESKRLCGVTVPTPLLPQPLTFYVLTTSAVTAAWSSTCCAGFLNYDLPRVNVRPPRCLECQQEDPTYPILKIKYGQVSKENFREVLEHRGLNLLEIAMEDERLGAWLQELSQFHGDVLDAEELSQKFLELETLYPGTRIRFFAHGTPVDELNRFPDFYPGFKAVEDL